MNFTIVVVSLFSFIYPQLAEACGGAGSIFSIHDWIVYLLYIFFVLHCYIIYLLFKKSDLLTRVNVVKKYTYLLLFIHVLVPIIAWLTYAGIAQACLGPRDVMSVKDLFLDTIYKIFEIITIMLALVSIAFYAQVKSEKNLPLNKVKVGKATAIIFAIITFIVAVSLSYAFWIVAPTLSDTSPFERSFLPTPSTNK